ncbi:MAG TPA: hypothetical protein VMG12_08920 [Polyangiaceae bacterium]|nr:hypothetical protein [Polyangiaceae bacterium]
MRPETIVRPWLLAVAVGCAAALQSSAASAQAAPAPAAPPADPAAAPPPPVIRPYAWIKPTIVLAGSPVESFGQPNASAVTAAGNPVLSAFPGAPGTQEEASLTFQIAQSRLGFWFNEKGAVRGQFELDFIDFTKSSPTTGALPRLRIGKVEWALSDSTVLMAGQDWDLFQPVNPYTVDIVAVAFQAGNTAFMRHQAKLIWHNDSLEVGGAIGLAGINNAAKAAVPEYSRMPSFALRAAALFGTAGRIGVSALATSWRFAPDTPAERKALAGGVGLYGDVTPAERFNIRFEAYGGQNLANMGSLSLGQGNAAEDVKEIGGFLSAKYGFTDAHAVYGLFGLAKVLNDEDVVPAYAYANVMMGMTPAESAATVAGVGPGMTQNMTARLGYQYTLDKMVSVMAEGFFFQSEHVLNPDFDADIDGKRTAVGGELGIFFTL